MPSYRITGAQKEFEREGDHRRDRNINSTHPEIGTSQQTSTL